MVYLRIERGLQVGAVAVWAACVAWVSPAAEPPERVTVKSIVEIDIALEKRIPPNLVVTAVGEVPSLGFSDVELNRVVYVAPPADGIQDYYLSAVPPQAPVPQVISRVKASDRWEDYQRFAPWLRGVRVHGAGEGVLVKMLAQEPQPK